MASASRACPAASSSANRQMKTPYNCRSRTAAVLTAPSLAAALRASNRRSVPAWSSMSIVPSSCRARNRQISRPAAPAVASARSNVDRAASRSSRRSLRPTISSAWQHTSGLASPDASTAPASSWPERHRRGRRRPRPPTRSRGRARPAAGRPTTGPGPPRGALRPPATAPLPPGRAPAARGCQLAPPAGRHCR